MRTAHRGPARHLAALVFAIAAASGLLVIPAVAPEVRAATPDLTIVGQAHYDVQPAQHRVRVTVDLVLTNHLRDTTTKRYYFDRAFLSILPGSSGYRLTGPGTPTVGVRSRSSTTTVLDMRLGQRLFSGKTAHYQLRFDLVDKGGAATRDVRVGSALVSFPVWAFASNSTPGSTVRVVFPAGYQVEVEAGTIPKPKTDSAGRVVFDSGSIAKPLSFFAYLVADRPAEYAEKNISTTVGAHTIDLKIQSWPDDPAWSKRVGGLVQKALPELSTRIGLDWRSDPSLDVVESVSRATGGYAGLFDPVAHRIEVAYFASDFIVLHESAHAWFNGSLLADRWANEGFASYYAGLVAPKFKAKVDPMGLGTDVAKAKIPLNAWGAVGKETTATEDYAYAASLDLAKAIAERAGQDGLRAVWADAAAGIGPYQPPVPADGETAAVGGSTGAPELVDGPPDWRGLLDLFEDTSGKTFGDLWEKWVVRDTDLPLLADRTAARAHYAAVVAAAGDWKLPKRVRDALRAWQFAAANETLDTATSVLDQRTAIQTAAEAAGLTAPDTLHAAFETDDGFASARAEVTAEMDAIDRYQAAAAARPVAPDLLQAVGLWQTTPEADLALARTLFAGGDLPGSAKAAASAASTWSSAAEVGRGRLTSAAIVVGAAFLAIVLAFAALIRRGRRRRVDPALVAAGAADLGVAAGPAVTVDAVGTGSVDPAGRVDPHEAPTVRSTVDAADPYATLGAPPDSGGPEDPGDAGATGVRPD